MPEAGGVFRAKGVAARRALACMRACPWAGGRANGVRPGAWGLLTVARCHKDLNWRRECWRLVDAVL